VTSDISTDDDAARVAKIAEKMGGVDVLINCDGFFPFDLFDDLSGEQWRKVINIYLTGYFLMTKAILPLI
jgi:NAD(P)-dependent dehydrogenase (short-subunit alcohol dehydrogenase family)